MNKYPLKRKPSPKVTAKMAVEIRNLYFEDGMKQHDIAAKYGINQGRVSEVVNGHRFPAVDPRKPPSRLI